MGKIKTNKEFEQVAILIEEARNRAFLKVNEELVLLYFKVGNIVSSIDAYEEASKLDPSDKEIWLNWSFIFYEQGDYNKAIDTLTLGFEEIPNDAELLYRMTVYLIEAGQFKEAFTYLENALILDFDGHTALFDFFPKIETQKALYKIIEQFRKENT